jgi:NAD-dependent dihydropyrimidine dehydrogenase PreA subunit
MRDKKIYIVPEPPVSKPIAFFPQLCNGCNQCVEVCQVDLMIPNPEGGKPPIVVYPGECWYCGCCVAACPNKGAIKLNELPMNKVYWKPKTPRRGDPLCCANR